MLGTRNCLVSLIHAVGVGLRLTYSQTRAKPAAAGMTPLERRAFAESGSGARQSAAATPSAFTACPKARTFTII